MKDYELKYYKSCKKSLVLHVELCDGWIEVAKQAKQVGDSWLYCFNLNAHREALENLKFYKKRVIEWMMH